MKVPSACARFRHDFYPPDGILGEIFENLLHLSDLEGGHFAALEAPHALAGDVFAAVQKFRVFNNAKSNRIDSSDNY